jgi:hypothetical protein
VVSMFIFLVKKAIYRISGGLLLLLFLTSPAQADVWGFLDERGIPRFAAEKVDERYELFFRGNGMPLLDSPDDLATPRPVPVPTAPPKLTVFFEVSPRYKQVKHHLREASNAYNIDIELLQAVIAAESGFDPLAVSPKGATGLMQLMPATAQRFGVQADALTPLDKKLTDPKTNVQAGTRYLRYLLNMFHGKLDLALAAYNAGEGAVKRAGNKIPDYKETQDYVKTVSNLYAWLKPPALIAESRKATKLPVNTIEEARARVAQAAPHDIVGGAVGRRNMIAPLGLTRYSTFTIDYNLSASIPH